MQCYGRCVKPIDPIFESKYGILVCPLLINHNLLFLFFALEALPSCLPLLFPCLLARWVRVAVSRLAPFSTRLRISAHKS